MSKALKAELVRQIYSIEDKWKERQKLEMELGIPTSDKLTLQFIEEETTEALRKYILNTMNNAIEDGDLFDVG